jgi:hypothetical protein
MQKRLAGTNPNCAVRIPITQRITLLAAASAQPCHNRFPTITVETTLKTHEM